jgi:hypothetical protein
MKWGTAPTCSPAHQVPQLVSATLASTSRLAHPLPSSLRSAAARDRIALRSPSGVPLHAGRAAAAASTAAATSVAVDRWTECTTAPEPGCTTSNVAAGVGVVLPMRLRTVILGAEHANVLDA